MAKRFTIEAVFKAVDRLSAPMSRMQREATTFSKRWTSNLKDIERVNSAVSGSIKKMALGVGAAGAGIAAALRPVISSGAEFEQAITNVGAVMLKSRSEIADLEAEAKRLGATTQFTAGQAAAGMEVMARAGFSSSEILAGMNGVLAATAAEGGEIAPVMEVIASTLKGMGLEASETGRVADVLTLASARTKSSILSLGESMKNLSPVARQFNISLEESVAMAALLQDVGMDASEAGTATSTMLTNLAKPSAEVASTLAKMGVSFKDARGNMKPVNVLFAEMTSALEKSGGNMEQVALFADLVGLRGQKAALNLAEMAKAGKLGALVEELQGAAGAAQRMADIRLDTFTGDLELFKSAIDGVFQSIFAAESGPMRGVVQSMTEWVNVNGKFIAQDVASFLQLVINNLDSIVTWTKRVAVGVAVFYAWSAAVKVLSVAMAIYNHQATIARIATYGFIGAMKIGKVVMMALNAVMALNPFILLGMAIVAAAGALWYFWGDISAFVTKAWDSFAGLWTAISDGFMSALRFIGQQLINLLTGPLRLVIMGLEKVGVLSAGTSARIEQAINIQSPQDRTARSISENTTSVNGEIRVSADRGSSATVTQSPKKGSGISLQATGAL